MKPRAAIPGQECPGLKKYGPKDWFSEPGRPRLRILAISFQHDLARGVHYDNKKYPGPRERGQGGGRQGQSP